MLKRKLCTLLLSSATLAAPLAVQADNYLGGDLAFTSVDAGNTSFSPSAAQFKMGTYVNDNFAVEGRLGTGISGDEKGNVELKVKHFVGAYARGIMPINEKAEVYGLIGFTDINFDTTIAADTTGSSDNDVSFGGGVNVKLDRDWALNFEYIRLYDDKIDNADVEVSSFNIGATMLF